MSDTFIHLLTFYSLEPLTPLKKTLCYVLHLRTCVVHVHAGCVHAQVSVVRLCYVMLLAAGDDDKGAAVLRCSPRGGFRNRAGALERLADSFFGR